MQKKLDVSVVIPAYNRGEDVLDCVRSIQKSLFQPKEIVVVDDGSTDNSVELLKSNNITVIEHGNNRGTAAARNTGAKHTTGEIIAFIDSDVIIHEDTILKLVEVFQHDETISVIVGLPDKTNKFQGICTEHFIMRVYFRLFSYSGYLSFTNGTTTAARRSTFDRVGGYNEVLETPGTEDVEFGLSVYQNNEKIYLDKTNVVTHNKKIDFLGLIKNDMTRTVARVFYMLRKRQVGSALKSKQIISTPMSQAVSALIVPVNLSFLFLMIYSPLFFFPFLVFLFFFYRLNYGYLSFVRKEKGMFFSIKIYLLLFIDMFFVHLAYWQGTLLYMMGRRY